MKTLIAAAVLVLASSSASAAGFSPWTNSSDAPDPISAQNVSVEATGFGPWRDRQITDNVDATANASGVAVNQGQDNVFRPWS
jgi:hypothetical protein